MRTVFLGTGEIGLPSLRWLMAEPTCELVGVFTQPDKPFGRKMKLMAPQVKVVAEAAGLPVFQPEKLRDPAAMADLTALRPDLLVVMAYGQILKKAVIDLPTVACINLHASLLPRHRGAAPIQAAIRDGDTESGITVMHIDVGLDSGDMILAVKCPITPEDTGGSLHDKLAELGPEALAQAIPLLATGTAPRTPQADDEVTHQGKLNREDGELDFSRPAVELERFIRAFEPWPGTYTRLDGQKLKVFPPTRVVPALPGTAPGCLQAIEGETLKITCGDGALALGEVQLEGRKRLQLREFLAGQRDQLTVGQKLG